MTGALTIAATSKERNDGALSDWSLAQFGSQLGRLVGCNVEVIEREADALLRAVFDVNESAFGREAKRPLHKHCHTGSSTTSEAPEPSVRSSERKPGSVRAIPTYVKTHLHTFDGFSVVSLSGRRDRNSNSAVISDARSRWAA